MNILDKSLLTINDCQIIFFIYVDPSVRDQAPTASVRGQSEPRGDPACTQPAQQVRKTLQRPRRTHFQGNKI